jgi:hypothetical protein
MELNSSTGRAMAEGSRRFGHLENPSGGFRRIEPRLCGYAPNDYGAATHLDHHPIGVI